MKTALRQLIEKIEANLNSITETSSEADRARFGAYSRILIDAKELEPVNEQQIKDAYMKGWNDEADGLLFDQAENYFNETYKP